MEGFDALWALVDRLRSDGGCAWDRAQSTATLMPHLRGEIAELDDALHHGADAQGSAQEELGDALFVLLSLAHAAQAEGRLELAGALDDIRTKMIRRHPHVFGDADETPSWEALKRAERCDDAPRGLLDGVPRTLPPLARAQALTRAAARVGFDWPDVAGVRDKVDEELAELDEAREHGAADAIEEELGDLLLTVVNLARFLDVDADRALRRAGAKFERRFRHVETATLADGGSVHTSSPSTLERHWREAKALEEDC